MADLRIITTSGAETMLKETAVEAFKASLRGELLTPDSPGYDEARAIWNAMIDRRPALIARCAGTADVMRAVDFARRNELLVAVRGGGHNIAGNAVCDGGLMIDLSPMKSVRVNPKIRRAYVEPGATLGDFDHEAQAFGLATSLGINSTTGVAGLTLGGGFGWLSRKHGMSVDNLVSADVVTADAKLIRASAKVNADLFWGIRGGGGNFGIVTCFEFQLHPVGPEVLAGLIVFPFNQAKTVLRKYREFVEAMPDDLSVWVVLRQAPPLPFLPADVHGKEVVAFATFYAGKASGGERAIEPLRSFGKPHGEHIGLQPYVVWQRAFDPLLTPGARNYWKSHNFSYLSDGALDIVIEYASKLPSPHCEIFIGLIGGQASRVAPDETAYSHRDAKFVLNVHSRWETAGEDQRCISWARDFFKVAAPHATGGVYVNFLTQEEIDRIPAAYKSEVWKRLVEVKKKWDPANLFRMNQNIKPA
ncbi:MAG: FAD-binding oxidoreductase [Verrucomicrobia bacterium]|nr:FAD-binding oxidoreductase [Verrucomicrobiota bacterium]